MPDLLPTRDQHDRSTRSQSLWLRVIAAACLLLVSIASSVQAVHTHGDWLPDSAHHAHTPLDASQAPGGEEHCPLCVAMHSALPVSRVVAVISALVSGGHRPTRSAAAAESFWHFASFSRPPPVCSFSI